MKWLEHEVKVARQEGKYGTQKLETNIFPGRDFPFESVACQDESTRLKIFWASICLSRDFSLLWQLPSMATGTLTAFVTWRKSKIGLWEEQDCWKSRHLSDPQACQQDAHQEDPRPPDLWLQGKPHRRGRPHHREGHLQVLEAVAGIFFWQFLFNKLTKKVFVFQDWFF